KKRYYGTGGTILQTLRRFIRSLKCLKKFKLNNLLLEANSDVGSCLEEVLEHSQDTLESLECLNYTSHILPLYIVGLFSNLKQITISSHSLSDDVLLLFANHTIYLKRLIIVQDELTIPYVCSTAAWIEVDKILYERTFEHSKWHVEMLMTGRCKCEPLWATAPAPIKSIIYETIFSKVNHSSIYTCLENYSKTLEIYAHLNSLCRVYIPKSFNERSDQSYIALVKNCKYLHTLA
ncbi:unnamed protein product, partial [Didymodactylos carnosus]